MTMLRCTANLAGVLRTVVIDTDKINVRRIAPRCYSNDPWRPLRWLWDRLQTAAGASGDPP
jgi:hypothetical protein